MMPIKIGGLIVFRIDHKRKNRHFCAQSTGSRIGKQSAAKAAPLERRIHRKAADPSSGNRRITGQTSNRFVREVLQ